MFLCVNGLTHFKGAMKIKIYIYICQCNKKQIQFKFVISMYYSELVSVGSLLANA